MNGRVQQRRRGNPPWLPSDGQAQGPAPTDPTMNALQTGLFRERVTPYNDR